MAFQTYPIQTISGDTLNFVGNQVSGANPSTILLSVPVSINVFGTANTNLLANPAGWINCMISGAGIYKIPYYK
jgi:hypothetical protein